jgi:hypothetical protein
MNKLLLLLVTLLSAGFVYAQKFAVAADGQNILYAGVDNPLTVSAANYPADAIYLTTNNGTISGYNGSFTSHIESPGAVKFTIFVKVKNKYKKIGEANFSVRKIPDPVVKVGPASGGEIQKRVLAAQDFVRADIDTFVGLCINYHLIGFRVIVLKSDSIVFNKFYEGNLLLQEIRDAIASLENGDMVIFKDASCTGGDGKLVNLKPIIFTIKE